MAQTDTPSTPVLLSQSLEFTVAATNPGVPILRSDWDYLKQKISRLQSPTSTYQNLASAAFGVGASAFVVAVLYSLDTKTYGAMACTVSWFLTLLFSCIGGLLLLAHNQQKPVLTCTK